MRQRLRPSGVFTKVIAGAALALFVGRAAATAQPTSTLASAFGCPPAAATRFGVCDLSASLYQASVRASRAARHEVMFETGTNADPETASAYADAATRSGDAIWYLASRPAGKAALAHLTRVTVAAGAEPSAELVDGALIVTIVPARGAAGRPSATEIEQALTR